jgi:HlyD family secretion protein
MKFAILLLLVAAGSAGAYYAPWPASAEATTKEDRGWLAVEPQRRDLSSFVLATGIVRPSVGAEVEVGSRVSGILAELHCDVGTRVKARDLLAVLDPTEFEASRKQAAAALEDAKAERDYAKAAFERKNKLGGVVPVDEIELAQRAFRVASARVTRAEATLESAQIQLDYTKIVAPIPGVVASVSTQVGETVAASFSAPTFVTIIDLDRLEVWAYVDETDIGRIDVGQTATFTVDTYSSTEFAGRVSAIYPKAEVRDNVVNYVVIIEILEDRGKVLRPEMTATTKIALEAGRDVFCVPNRAIRTDAAGSYVMLRDDTGEALRRGVALGFRGRGFTEIVEGLAPTERVLVAQ